MLTKRRSQVRRKKHRHRAATTHGTCQQEGTHAGMASEVVDVLGRHSNGVFMRHVRERGAFKRSESLDPSAGYTASMWTRTRYERANN